MRAPQNDRLEPTSWSPIDPIAGKSSMMKRRLLITSPSAVIGRVESEFAVTGPLNRRDACRSSLEAREIEPISVNGRERPVQLYVVSTESDAA